MQKFIRQSRAEGVISYNQYNTRALHESELIRVLSSFSDNMDQTLYSNYPAGVWFFTRRNVAESPRGTIIDELNIEELSVTFQGWPWDKPGYLIWFLPNEYDHVLEPDILNKLADLQTNLSRSRRQDLSCSQPFSIMINVTYLPSA